MLTVLGDRLGGSIAPASAHTVGSLAVTVRGSWVRAARGSMLFDEATGGGVAADCAGVCDVGAEGAGW